MQDEVEVEAALSSGISHPGKSSTGLVVNEEDAMNGGTEDGDGVAVKIVREEEQAGGEGDYDDDEEWGLNGDEGDYASDADGYGGEPAAPTPGPEAGSFDVAIPAHVSAEDDEEAMMNNERPRAIKVLEIEEERHRPHEPLVSVLQRYNSVSTARYSLHLQLFNKDLENPSYGPVHIPVGRISNNPADTYLERAGRPRLSTHDPHH